ncbi:MAG: hypothetical protein GY749_20840 [Desulfobacteraceae bacterium]|nr:hypothetical protein [Desulfobacteraceae bacterium]
MTVQENSFKHQIKINLPGLLKMSGTNIYAEPDVAVREMIQNAHDKYLSKSFAP